MAEIFRELPKFHTDVYLGIRFLSDTLGRGGGHGWFLRLYKQ